MLARNNAVDNMLVLFVSRNGFWKIGKFNTRRFYFNVKLFLPGEIYIRNIFSTFFAYVASKVSSYTAREVIQEGEQRIIFFSADDQRFSARVYRSATNRREFEKNAESILVDKEIDVLAHS